jgi:hypothetical protein
MGNVLGEQATETELIVTGTVTVTVAVPDLVVSSVLWAVTVTVAGFGTVPGAV